MGEEKEFAAGVVQAPRAAAAAVAPRGLSLLALVPLDSPLPAAVESPGASTLDPSPCGSTTAAAVATGTTGAVVAPVVGAFAGADAGANTGVVSGKHEGGSQNSAVDEAVNAKHRAKAGAAAGVAPVPKRRRAKPVYEPTPGASDSEVSEYQPSAAAGPYSSPSSDELDDGRCVVGGGSILLCARGGRCAMGCGMCARSLPDPHITRASVAF
jgi:hypothetical protein